MVCPGYYPGRDLLDRLAKAAQDLMPTFSSQNISNAVMAFAKLEHHPGRGLLQAVASATLISISQFTPQVCHHFADPYSDSLAP